MNKKYIGFENEGTEIRSCEETFCIGDKCDIIHTEDGKGFLDHPIKGTLVDIKLTPVSEYFSEQTAVVRCDSDGHLVEVNPKYLCKPMEQILCKVCKKVLSYVKELFWGDGCWNYKYSMRVKNSVSLEEYSGPSWEYKPSYCIEPLCVECWKKMMHKAVDCGREVLTQEEYNKITDRG